MEDMYTYVDRDLVSHARGQHLSLGFLQNWAITNSRSKVSSSPEVKKLMKGWLAFLMSSKEEADMLRIGLWEMVRVPIVLHK